MEGSAAVDDVDVEVEGAEVVVVVVVDVAEAVGENIKKVI